MQMDILQQVQQQLLIQLANYQDSQQTYGRLHTTFAYQFNLLEWQKNQNNYPHYFFQNRDSSFILASVGEIARFTDLAEAETFVQQQPDLLLNGGLSFNGESIFFLPRVAIIQRAENIEVNIFFKLAEIETEKVVIEKLVAELFICQSLAPLTIRKISLQQESSDQSQWQKLIEQALVKIANHQFAKVVLAKESIFSTERAVNFYDFLYASQQKHKNCYHFLWAFDQQQAFLGSSPECLYQRQNKQLYTEALAGTAPIVSSIEQNQQNAEWLLTDLKNNYENQLVITGITENLTAYCEEIKIGQRHIRTLHNVQHLCCNIETELLEGYADKVCLSALHPTPAVAGYPKQEALDFIQQYEPFARGWYAGALGFLTQQTAEFSVAIRSALVKANNIHIFAGAGIVAGSDPLLEWQEIERKAAGLVSLLQQDLE